jgi:hypothetical protein
MDNYRGSLQKPQAFLKMIVIIHGALLAGQVLFGITALASTKSMGIIMKPADDPFFYVAPFLTLSSIAAGIFLFKQQLAKLPEKVTLKEKIAGYQTGLIIKYALTEGASLFGIVAYLLTGNLLYLIITGVNVIYFFWIRPTKDKIVDDLNLSYEDKIELEV